MNYNVGDVVKIVEKKGWIPDWNPQGDMGKWPGKVMTISQTYERRNQIYYHMVEDNGMWTWSAAMIAKKVNETPDYFKSIVIRREGNTVTAKAISNFGIKLKETEARCHPDDTFNFQKGVELALERLFEEPIKPYLVNGRTHYGEIGEKADFTALFGAELHVGDVVSVYNSDSSKLYEDSFVCKDDDHGYFIKGLAGCDFACGVAGDWQIQKIIPYNEITHNTKIGEVTAILESEGKLCDFGMKL